MGTLNTALGMGIKENPIIFSPFVAGFNEGQGGAPSGSDDLTTEAGVLITTESAIDIITE